LVVCTVTQKTNTSATVGDIIKSIVEHNVGIVKTTDMMICCVDKPNVSIQKHEYIDTDSRNIFLCYIPSVTCEVYVNSLHKITYNIDAG
jgi:hypothetical protein